MLINILDIIRKKAIEGYNGPAHALHALNDIVEIIDKLMRDIKFPPRNNQEGGK